MAVGAIARIESAEIHLRDGVEHRPDQVILRHPLAQRRRHQQHLIAVTANEVHSHDRRLPTRPDCTLFPTATDDRSSVGRRCGDPPLRQVNVGARPRRVPTRCPRGPPRGATRAGAAPGRGTRGRGNASPHYEPATRTALRLAVSDSSGPWSPRPPRIYRHLRGRAWRWPVRRPHVYAVRGLSSRNLATA